MSLLRAAYALVQLPGGNVDKETACQRSSVCVECTYKVSSLCSLNNCFIEILVQREQAKCPDQR